MPKSVSEAKIQAFIDKVNGSYKSSVLETGAKFGALKMNRFSSGILSVDLALGGGWPFSRIAILAGEYSTGKTLMALKAMQNVEKHCMHCRKKSDLCKCGDFTPTPSLFIDVEGAFDREWAILHGFNEKYNVVARPEAAEHTIDIIDSAMRDNTFGLIILDSIAALTPMKEIEESAEDWQMGLAARLCNKAMRRWNASLNKMSQENPSGGPCLLCLNQIREKIGVVMGDPRTLPGGKGQLFNSSIIIFTRSTKVTDEPDSGETAMVEMGGVTKKNKTYIPKLEYGMSMALRNIDGVYKKGEIDNDDQLIKYGKKYEFVKKIGDGIGFDVWAAKSEKAFKLMLREKPDLALKLWRSIVNHTTGQII
jgi:recombination protein RecA